MEQKCSTSWSQNCTLLISGDVYMKFMKIIQRNANNKLKLFIDMERYHSVYI